MFVYIRRNRPKCECIAQEASEKQDHAKGRLGVFIDCLCQKVGAFDHPYPTTKIMWRPDPQGVAKDQVATMGDYLRLWDVGENGITEAHVFNNNTKLVQRARQRLPRRSLNPKCEGFLRAPQSITSRTTPNSRDPCPTLDTSCTNQPLRLPNTSVYTAEPKPRHTPT